MINGTNFPVLYCFSFDIDTGIVSKTAIYEYSEIHPSKYFPEKVEYHYKHNGSMRFIKGINLDCLVNWKVHTFNESMDDAVKVIKTALKEKQIEYQNGYLRYSNMLDLLENAINFDTKLEET